MKIEFDKQQFERLLTMVYLGEWMVNAHRVDDRNKEYEDLLSYIFSHTKGNELEKYTDFKKDEPAYPNRKYEDEIHSLRFIDEYDEETFWSELIDRMATREIERKYGIQKIKEMDRDEYVEILCDMENKIGEYFNKYGLLGLRMDKLDIIIPGRNDPCPCGSGKKFKKCCLEQ